MILPVAVIVSVGFGLAATAVIAFYWAARNGQFRDLDRGARSIFDEGEPVGRPTDMVWSRKRRAVRNP